MFQLFTIRSCLSWLLHSSLHTLILLQGFISWLPKIIFNIPCAALEWITSSRSSDFSYWRKSIRTKFWVLGVIIATLRGPLKEVFVCACVCVCTWAHIHICVYFYIYLYIYEKSVHPDTFHSILTPLKPILVVPISLVVTSFSNSLMHFLCFIISYHKVSG